MSDLFAVAAARAQRERAKEEKRPEGNALKRLIEERRAERAEEERKAEIWTNYIKCAFDKTAELCGILGAPVESMRYEDGIVWIRREKEAIKLPDVTIRDEADLRRACIKIIGSVCKA